MFSYYPGIMYKYIYIYIYIYLNRRKLYNYQKVILFIFKNSIHCIFLLGYLILINTSA